MASQIDICNAALIQLGVEPLTALDTATKGGRLCLARWVSIRDALLASHFWGFAMKRATLPLLSVTPEFGFTYAYQLPSDCLRVMVVEDGTPYSIEAGMLMTDIETTDEQEVNVTYIARISEPGTWSAHFAEAFSAQLATDLCLPLTDSVSRYQVLQKMAATRLMEAQVLDAREAYGKTATDDDDDTWIEART
jgi:hypothetical protein